MLTYGVLATLTEGVLATATLQSPSFVVPGALASVTVPFTLTTPLPGPGRGCPCCAQAATAAPVSSTTRIPGSLLRIAHLQCQGMVPNEIGIYSLMSRYRALGTPGFCIARSAANQSS